MDTYAYKMELGYDEPLHDLNVALNLSGGSTPDALDLVGDMLTQAAARARRLASILRDGDFQVEGLMVTSEERITNSLLSPVPGYLSSTQLQNLITKIGCVVKHLGTSTPHLTAVAPVSGAVLADAFSLIDQHDNLVGFVCMNARDYADLRRFGHDILNIESRRDLLKIGLMGSLWGARVFVHRDVPADKVFLFTDMAQSAAEQEVDCVVIGVQRGGTRASASP